MIDYTMSQLIAAGGLLAFALLISVYLLGHLARGVWHWIDRGESNVRHVFDAVLKTYVLQITSGEHANYYIIGKSENKGKGLSCLWAREKAKIFFSRKSAEQFAQLEQLDDEPADIKIVESEMAAIILMIGSIAIAFTMGTAMLFVQVPTIMMFVLSGLGTVFGSRYLRDIQKSAVKLKNALIKHLDDLEAHTPNAEEIDVDNINQYGQ